MANFRGSLTVQILKADDLRNVETFGKNDPYVKVVIGDHVRTTAVKKSAGTSAEFGEVFKFKLGGSEDYLVLSVIDKNKLRDETIGSEKIAFADLVRFAGHEHWYKINHGKRKAGLVLILSQFVGIDPHGKAIDTENPIVAAAAKVASEVAAVKESAEEKERVVNQLDERLSYEKAKEEQLLEDARAKETEEAARQAEVDRIQAEAEAKRQEMIEEAARLKEEAEKERAQAAAEAQRVRDEAEKARAAMEAETARIRQEAEETATRAREEAERLRLAREEEEKMNPTGWVKFEGSLPENALIGGHEADGRPLYIARACIGGGIHPGKFGHHFDGTARIGYGMEEQVAAVFDVFVVSPKERYEWVECHLNKVPQGAVVGGKEADGKELFVARDLLDGSQVPGKAAKHLIGGCMVPYGGKEVPRKTFEILVKRV